MRTFQADITELPQDASKEPPSFNKNRWRFPVRHDLAVEYLCISLEEASTIFGGRMTSSMALQLLGIQSNKELQSTRSLFQVSSFLEATGISYCEFLELHESGFLAFKPDTYPPTNEFPPCLPCCAENLGIAFNSETALGEVVKLVIFIWLWKRLRRRCCEPLSMKTLADIGSVLQIFNTSNVNEGFIPQLASLLMLAELWKLPWTNVKRVVPNTPPGDQRTELLALWSGAAVNSPQYEWAVEALLQGVEKYSIGKFKCPKRSASWRKIIGENLNDLAGLAGFDGTTYKWNSKPTCTIRFAEVLSKIYASKFTVGEILFLFTTKKHLRGDDPYPVTETDESFDNPLNVPEDDARKWAQSKIEATIREMGGIEKHKVNGDTLKYFGEHFFAEIFEQEGHAVGPKKRRFEITFQPGQTSPQMWLQA